MMVRGIMFTVYAPRPNGDPIVFRTTDEGEANRMIARFGGTMLEAAL